MNSYWYVTKELLYNAAAFTAISLFYSVFIGRSMSIYECVPLVICIKHRLKRILKERRCGVCNVTYTKHKPCLVLLSVKAPYLEAPFVDNYRLKRHTGIVLRPKRSLRMIPLNLHKNSKDSNGRKTRLISE